MRKVFLVVSLLFLSSGSTAAWAWGVGSIADQLLNDHAKAKVAQILGFELRWADCVKSVSKNDDETFS